MQSLLALQRYANWRFVRSLAELQILTRASYAMLIIVPILAALWPAVRLVVNQHNKAVVEAAAIFEKSADRLNEIESKVGKNLFATEAGHIEGQRLASSMYQDQLQAAIYELKRQVARYNDDYVPKTIETPLMPRALAAAFFAALAVVLAHSLALPNICAGNCPSHDFGSIYHR